MKTKPKTKATKAKRPAASRAKKPNSRAKSKRSGSLSQGFFSKRNVGIGFIGIFAAVGVYVAFFALAAGDRDTWNRIAPHLRQCETGNRNIHNPSGAYHGYYQFDLSTWRGVGFSGDPHNYSLADQDEGAYRLYQSRGVSPWPICGPKAVNLANQGGSAPSGQAPAPGGPAGVKLPAGDWRLEVRGMCVDVYAYAKNNGDVIKQWSCNNGTNQRFRFEQIGTSFYYRIVGRDSGKCIDYDANRLANGGKVQLWVCGTQDNQLFGFHKQPDGRYRIQSKSTGGLCLDSPGGQGVGANMQQYQCIGGTTNENQLFKVTFAGNSTPPPAPTPTPAPAPAPTPPPPPPAAGSGTRYKIRSVFNNRCVDADIAPGQNKDGGRVQQWDCISNNANQLIRLNSRGSGWYEMKFQHSPYRCVDAYAFGKTNGSAIVQWPCNGADNQLVKKVYRGNGSQGDFYQLEFKHAPGVCLDFDSNQNRNGGKVQAWQCLSNNSNQRFYLLVR